MEGIVQSKRESCDDGVAGKATGWRRVGGECTKYIGVLDCIVLYVVLKTAVRASYKYILRQSL